VLWSVDLPLLRVASGNRQLLARVASNLPVFGQEGLFCIDWLEDIRFTWHLPPLILSFNQFVLSACEAYLQSADELE